MNLNDNAIYRDLLENGILYLQGSIDAHAATELGKALIWLNRKDPGQVERKEILLYIDSEGGKTQAGMSIYDMIYCSRIPVTGIVYRRAYSAAAIILQACHQRVAMQNAEILFHPCSFELGLDEIDEDMEQGLRLVKQRESNHTHIVAVRSGKSVEEAWDFIKRETYLSAEKALEHGFVDKVIHSIPEIVTLR